MPASQTVDSYVHTLPPEAQTILNKLRKMVKEIAPEAVESMSYGMPGYKLYGKPLVYFAAWKAHIGFYVTPAGNAAFQKEIAPYKTSKGAIQFPLDKPFPYDLAKQIITYRTKEMEQFKK